MLGISKLTKLIVKSFVGPFFVAFFITLFILIMQFVWRYVDDLMGKGLEFNIILEILFYAGIGILPLSLPLAVLFASILTLGNLGEKSELTALKVSGLSLNQILRPLLFLVCLITLGAFLFAAYILPAVRVKFNRLLYDITSTRPAFSIEEKLFYRDIEGVILRINKKDSIDKGKLYDVLIYDQANKTGIDKNFRMTLADNGRISVVEENKEKKLSVELFNGHIYEQNYNTPESYKTHPHKQYIFARMEKLMDMPGFTMKNSDEDHFKYDYSTENFIKLNYIVDSVENQQKKMMKNAVQFWYSRLLFFERPQISLCFAEVEREKDSIYSTIPSAKLPFIIQKKLENNQISDSLNTENLTEIENMNTSINTKNLSISVSEPPIIDEQIENNKKLVTGVKKNINSILQNAQFPWIDRQERMEKQLRNILIEWHFRITFPLICLVMFFIGAPMGAIAKKGGLGLPILFSVLFFIVFYVTDTISKTSAMDGELPVFMSHWTAFFVLIPMAFYLNRVARKELSLTDLVPIKKYFNLLKTLFLRKKQKKI